MPNKRSLDHRLNQLCQNREEKFAILIIGLDNFKSINDHNGFKAGNKVLIEVSQRLKRIMNDKKGFISHLGGDEFAILLEDFDHKDHTTHLAEQILEVISRPMEIKDTLLYVTTSIGISLFPIDGDEAGSILERADIALNKVKSSRNK